MTEERVTRGAKSPRVERVSDRPERVRFGESKGPLAVTGLNPDYHYYWPVDQVENGHNIFRFVQAGWEFCTKDNDPNIKIGDNYVYSTANVTGGYRVPANKTGDYHYLMRIRKEWADEDFLKEQADIDARESGTFRADKGEGQYGSVRYE